MTEMDDNTRFYLISDKPGYEKTLITNVANYRDIGGDSYELEEEGYYSVSRTSKVTLYKEGYYFLLGILEAYGPSVKVRFIKEEKDDATIEAEWVRRSDTYVNMYELTLNEEEDNPSVDCKLIHGGDMKTLIASMDDEYDVVGPDAPELPYVQVRFDPRLIFRRSRLELADDSVEIESSPLTGGNPHFVIPTSVKYQSDENISGTPSITMYGIREFSGETELNIGGCFYYTADRNRSLNINVQGSYTIPGGLPSGKAAELHLMVFDEGDDLNFKEKFLLHTTMGSTSGQEDFTYDVLHEIDILEGESLAVAHELVSVDDYKLVYSDFSINVSEDSTFGATVSKAVKPIDMFTQLGRLILEDPDYNIVSSVFGPGGKHENKLLIHGTWLRNMPPIINEGEDDERRLQANIKFEDLLGAYSILEPLRLDVTEYNGKDTIAIGLFKEIQQNFTGIRVGKTVDAFDLLPVSGKGRDVLGDNYYRRIKIGSTTSGSNYGEVNNLYSIAGYAEWTSPHTDSEGEYEVVTEFRTGAEDIELQRQIQYEDDPDVDAERDDDWFLVDAEWNGAEYVVKGWEHYYEEKPTGVYSADTNYNWCFAPVELLRGHGYKINAGLKQVSDKYLTNPTGNCNLSLKTKREDEIWITSNKPFPISLLEAPRIRPMLVNFSFTMNNEVLEQLRGYTQGVDNKFGLVEVLYRGEVMKGRLYSANTEDTAEFKIIQVDI